MNSSEKATSGKAAISRHVGLAETVGATQSKRSSNVAQQLRPNPLPLVSSKSVVYGNFEIAGKISSPAKSESRTTKENAEKANLATITETKEGESEKESIRSIPRDEKVEKERETSDKDEKENAKLDNARIEKGEGTVVLKKLISSHKKSTASSDNAKAFHVARKISWLKAYKSAKCDRQLKKSTKNSEIEDVITNLLSDKDKVSVAKFWNAIKATGLQPEDPRLRECRNNFRQMRKLNSGYMEEYDFQLDKDTFKKCISENIWVVGRAFKKDLIIPEFHGFGQQIENIYLKCMENTTGKVADYLAHLAGVDVDTWGVAVCTTDGQRVAFGKSATPFCLQACSMPLNYALAVSELGATEVHKWVGFEPSGSAYNDLSLNQNDKPHNPMVNAGALVTLSLIKSDKSAADRFDYLFRGYRNLAGGDYVGFNNSVYLSEKEIADRNFAIAYYLSENKCMPAGSKILQVLELLFQVCSIEVTPESGSVMAATLATGGICPITGVRVLASEAVRNTLSLMHSCGMYDYSGHFAFKVGLPAKSGIGGAILLVVPRVMGVCCYGPSLDHNGNSVKGIQFCEELVKVFNFHNYDLLCDGSDKNDPRMKNDDNKATSVVSLLFGAARGDVATIRRFALSGMDMSSKDYDGRTALHVAAAEGHLIIVRMLVEKCRVIHDIKDRWGHQPIDDARLFGRTQVVEYMELHVH